LVVEVGAGVIAATRIVIGLLVLAGLSACVSTRDRTPGEILGLDDTAAFDVGAFFEGRTEGRGTLKIATRAREAVIVDGRGRVEDGVIILDQTVRRGDRAAETRQWRLIDEGAGRFSGTLSDAAGPVSGEFSGNVLHLRFAMDGGVRADQWLTLQDEPGQAGGQRVMNVMIMRKFGLPVARLDEVIVRVGEE
jgi:predicted secreted protein